MEKYFTELDRLDLNIYSLYRMKYPDIYSFLNSINNEIKVIVECGGHMGTDTIKLSKISPKCLIYTIEANENLFNKHLKNLPNKFGNIKVFNHGLSNINGEKIFYLEPPNMGDGGASSFQGQACGAFSHLRNGEIPKKILCKTLKTFLDDNNINKIDLLWLDVEAHEFEILNTHANKILPKIKYIFCEVSFIKNRENCKLYGDIKDHLEKYNFAELGTFIGGKKVEKSYLVGLHGCDVLFVNKNF